MKALNFIKEAFAELKKVSWPTKKQTFRLTAYVIGVSVIVGLYVSGLDYLLKEAVGMLIK